jgi:hypothetical protein
MQSYFSDDPYDSWWIAGQNDAKWSMMQRAIDIYRPKAICMGDMEPMASVWKKRFHEDIGMELAYNNHHGEFCLQLNGIKNVYNLAKQYDDYDIFVRARYDSWFYEPVDFAENWAFRDSHIMLSRGVTGARSWHGCPYDEEHRTRSKLNPFFKINDQFFWSSREPYGYLAHLIDYAETYCDPNGEGILFETENLYYRHMLYRDSRFRAVLDDSAYQVLVRQDTPDSHLIYER